jgi:hypothetical protein
MADPTHQSLADAERAVAAARNLLASLPDADIAHAQVIAELIAATESLAAAVRALAVSSEPIAPPTPEATPAHPEDYWAARWRV